MLASAQDRDREEPEKTDCRGKCKEDSNIGDNLV